MMKENLKERFFPISFMSVTLTIDFFIFRFRRMMRIKEVNKRRMYDRIARMMDLYMLQNFFDAI